MKRLRNGYKYLFFLLSTSIFSFSYDDLNISQYSHVIKEIENGKIFVNLERNTNQFGNVVVIGILNEDIKKSWQILNQENVYADVIYSKILEKNSEFLIKEKKFDYPWPFKDRITIIKEKIKDELYAKEWVEIGGEIPINRGAIRLFPYNGKTIMIFKISFNPGVGIIPDWIVEQGMKFHAPKIISDVRNRLKDSIGKKT